MTGEKEHDWRPGRKNFLLDYYDIKGVFSAVFHRLGLKDIKFEPSKALSFEQGQRADICYRKQNIGRCGKIDPDVLKAFDIKQGDIFFGEVNCEALYPWVGKLREYAPISEFPAIVRDVSLAVKQEILYSRVMAVLQKTGGNLLVEAKFIEEYLGEKIPDGYRGIVLSLVYQSATRTLTEEEVGAVHQRICENFVAELGAIIR